MGKLESIIALVDEFVVALAVIFLIIVGLRASGMISTTTAIIVSIIIALAFGIAGYLAALAQLEKPKTGVESLIGEVGEAIEDIAPEGMILIKGEYWRAKNKGNIPIKKGQKVIVKDFKGLLLIVEPLHKEQKT